MTENKTIYITSYLFILDHTFYYDNSLLFCIGSTKMKRYVKSLLMCEYIKKPKLKELMFKCIIYRKTKKNEIH